MQEAAIRDPVGDEFSSPEMIFLGYQAWHVPLRAMTIGWQTAATFATGMLGFTAQRLTENQKTARALMECWNWSGAETEQRAWLEAAVRQYREIGAAATRLQQDATDRLAAELGDVWTLPAGEEPAPERAAVEAEGNDAPMLDERPVDPA
ncbi:hypothetical protein [Aurantimonas sp. VKM B-3413]|uniref:hypothetical protein n=1 Tax=Aurantimonas sp. VKM B-3413 TaxID=2779401 RepID=UPI001E3E6425|nr:hypothetical protein [Aurantimonas sp. VKM B-3413]MCB8839900.1 hypothetical protein [Aurantimonas sp. VKM B-3413]